MTSEDVVTSTAALPVALPAALAGATLVSSREAEDALGTLGISRRSARLVLASGLAGQPLRTRGALLYDATRVRDLVAAPEVERALQRVRWPGLLVVRLGAATPLDLAASQAAQFAAVAGPWQLSPWLRARLGLAVRQHGRAAFVATVGTFVALGADIVGTHVRGATTGGGPDVGSSEQEPDRAGAMLELSPPSDWFDGFRGRRLPTGGGGPWRYWSLPPPALPPPALQE